MLRLILTLLLAVLPGAVRANESPDSPLAWPEITREARPWAYWWCMASAVDQTNLTKELTRYRDAGYGDVHIIPIYGAKGWETNYITYLSPRWMAMLNYTVTEARRLGLGAFSPSDGERDGVRGRTVDLTKRIRPDGSVNWTAPGAPVSDPARFKNHPNEPDRRSALRIRLFYNPGFNLIDATILPAFGRHHLIVKDETRNPAKKHLRIASSDDMAGFYGNLGPPFTRDWVEGPSALQIGG